MVHLPNDDTHGPPSEPDQIVAQHYRGNIFFKGKLVFVISLHAVNYQQFLVACQKFLIRQSEEKHLIKKISLWYLDTVSARKIKTNSHSISNRCAVPTAFCKISSDVDLQTAFCKGSSKGTTLVQNFVVKCEVAAQQGTHKSLQQKETCIQGNCDQKIKSTKGKKVGRENVTRAFHLLEVEARRSRNLQSQLRLLNRAFQQITTPISKRAHKRNSALYERRRRKFVAMLKIMRKRPQRAGAWLSKMRRQHADNVAILRILSILDIFVNNLLDANDANPSLV